MPIGQLIASIVLIFLNALFVATEMAIIKARITRVEEIAGDDKRSIRIVKKIRSNLDSYLSAVQLGVTLTSLALGWVGEPAVSALLVPVLKFLDPYVSKTVLTGITIGTSFFIITYFAIVFGELAPKWLAIHRPEQISLRLGYPLFVFYKVCFPLIWFLNSSARWILSRFGIQPANDDESTFSEQELRIALDRSEEGGAIPESAGDIADRAFHFGRSKVRDVMTPRPDVAFLDVDDSLEENLKLVERMKYSRYPVCRGNLEDIIGRVHVRDLLLLIDGSNTATLDMTAPAKILEAIAHPMLIVPETKLLDAMLTDFRTKQMEMAIVQDEYGVTAGIVTLEDVLEELVGEIQQEFAIAPPEVEVQEDGSWIVDGKITLSRLLREYEVGEEVEGIETVGGLILASLSGLPTIGYSVEQDGWRYEITEIERRRIRRVRITRTIPLAEPYDDMDDDIN